MRNYREPAIAEHEIQALLRSAEEIFDRYAPDITAKPFDEDYPDKSLERRLMECAQKAAKATWGSASDAYSMADEDLFHERAYELLRPKVEAMVKQHVEPALATGIAPSVFV